MVETCLIHHADANTSSICATKRASGTRSAESFKRSIRIARYHSRLHSSGWNLNLTSRNVPGQSSSLVLLEQIVFILFSVLVPSSVSIRTINPKSIIISTQTRMSNRFLDIRRLSGTSTAHPSKSPKPILLTASPSFRRVILVHRSFARTPWHTRRSSFCFITISSSPCCSASILGSSFRHGPFRDRPSPTQVNDDSVRTCDSIFDSLSYVRLSMTRFSNDGQPRLRQGTCEGRMIVQS